MQQGHAAALSGRRTPRNRTARAQLGQTWHLPCDDDRPTYRKFVARACEIFGVASSHKVIGRWALTAVGLVSKQVRELRELLPRYENDNLFDSAKFKRRFPEFAVTTYRQGLELIRQEPSRSAE